MIYLDDVIHYVKHNKVRLDIVSDYKHIYDYDFHIEENTEVSVYLHLNKKQYGGEVCYIKIIKIKLSDIISQIRKEKLKKIKS